MASLANMALKITIFIAVFTCIMGEFVSKEPSTFNGRLTEAKRILADVPLIDGHNDLAWTIHLHSHNLLRVFPFNKNLSTIEPWASEPMSQTDIPRLREGMVGAQFWASYVPCNISKSLQVTKGYQQSDLIKRLIGKYPKDLKFASSAQDILNAFTEGKIASLIGVEGGHTLNNSLALLRSDYRYGVRYVTLTHSCSTSWAQSSVDENNENSKVIGLSDFGKKMVKEMNKIGMLVDLSHVSKQTMDDVLEVTSAPVIFSHSSARALCNHTRNVPDDVLRKMTTNGGIVMVNFYNEYLTCSDKATLHDVIDHINHIRDVSGVDFVGLGSDYNGVALLPDGLEDVSKFPNLFAELLLDPKWDEKSLKKLAGLNFLRVFSKVESVKSLLTFQQKIHHKHDQE